MAQKACKWWCQ